MTRLRILAVGVLALMLGFGRGRGVIKRWASGPESASAYARGRRRLWWGHGEPAPADRAAGRRGQAGTLRRFSRPMVLAGMIVGLLASGALGGARGKRVVGTGSGRSSSRSGDHAFGVRVVSVGVVLRRRRLRGERIDVQRQLVERAGKDRWHGVRSYLGFVSVGVVLRRRRPWGERVDVQRQLVERAEKH